MATKKITLDGGAADPDLVGGTDFSDFEPEMEKARSQNKAIHATERLTMAQIEGFAEYPVRRGRTMLVEYPSIGQRKAVYYAAKKVDAIPDEEADQPETLTALLEMVLPLLFWPVYVNGEPTPVTLADAEKYLDTPDIDQIMALINPGSAAAEVEEAGGDPKE